MDFGEEIFACVERETLEETGLKVRGKKVIAYTNDIQKAEDKHEVTLYVLCDRENPSQQPEVTSNYDSADRLFKFCEKGKVTNTTSRYSLKSHRSLKAGSGRVGRISRL